MKRLGQFIISTIAVFTLFLVSRGSVDAAELNDSDFYRLENTYMVKQENIRYFDIEKAQNNHESEEVLDFGYLVNDFIEAKNNHELDTFEPYLYIKVYGNYCGKGNNGKKPIDDLDKFCQTHDQCYDKKGWGNKSCDQAFVNSLKANKHKWTGYKRVVAEAAILAFG